ncbi:MAG: hypothetical protein PVSMB5_01830 [Ktedonobacteraceae bacterium]
MATGGHAHKRDLYLKLMPQQLFFGRQQLRQTLTNNPKANDRETYMLHMRYPTCYNDALYPR